MWNIFIGIILGCLGVLAIAFTIFVLIAMINTIREKIYKKNKK